MRRIINFNTKWAFTKEATEVPASMPEKWYWVTLPHTWNGEYPADENALKKIVEGISFYNAKRYFEF